MKRNTRILLAIGFVVLSVFILRPSFRSNQEIPNLTAAPRSISSTSRHSPGNLAEGREDSQSAQMTRADSLLLRDSAPPATTALVVAVVDTGGGTSTLTVDAAGEFPRVITKARQQVDIRITYPRGEPGQPVFVEAQDGGELDTRSIAKLGALDDSKSLRFAFTTSNFDGTHRVVLRKGADVKVFDFWVGPENPLAGKLNQAAQPSEIANHP
jgi:hypothetical protein